MEQGIYMPGLTFMKVYILFIWAIHAFFLRIGTQPSMLFNLVFSKHNSPWPGKTSFSRYLYTALGNSDFTFVHIGGGRVVQWYWANFQCWGVLLIWIIVGQGPTGFVVGLGGGCLDIFSRVHHFSLLSPSLWETAQYRLQYCLKGLLNPNQPTNCSYEPMKNR